MKKKLKFYIVDCVRENRTNQTEHVWRAFTTQKAHRRFGLNEANNSKTHACDLISIQQQSAREYWTKKMNTKRKQLSTVGLFSHVKMLYLQIFRLNPIPDLRSTATNPINRTHLHTRTSTNDTTLIEWSDEFRNKKWKKKLLHSDFTGVLFKSLMDLWTPSLWFDCWNPSVI